MRSVATIQFMSERSPTDGPALTDGDSSRTVSIEPPTVSDLRGLAGEGDFELERVLAAASRGLFGEAAAPPAMIGRYRIDGRIGAGGMGEVYLGFDEDLERKVAIKLVRADLSRFQGPERLRREAKALARLSHPNVVQVYEVGVHRRRTFLAMEFVEGQTLGQFLDAGRRPWPVVLDRFIAAGRGLAAAHAAGVTHRDFKPDNVLLAASGRVCVADFGLALTGELEPEPSTDKAERILRANERLSATGTVLGTIRYMPLEQLQGVGVDARADQFAFCAALYETLWSNPAFPIESIATRRAALEQLEPHKPPHGRAPHGLWRVLRRGLARDPERRWPDMDSLLDALEAVPQRRRALVLGSCAAPLLAGAITLAWLDAPEPPRDPCATIATSLDAEWNVARAEQLRSAARTVGLPFAEAGSETALVELTRWRDRWIEQREQLCRATVAGITPGEVLGLRGACLERQRPAFAATIEILAQADADVLVRVPVLLAALPDPLECRDDERLMLGVRPPPPERSAELAAVQSELARARTERLARRSSAAAQRIERAQARAETLAYPPVLAEALAEAGELALMLSNTDAGLALLERAVDLAEAHRDDSLAARVWLNLATRAVFDLRDRDRGEAWLRRAAAAEARVGVDALAEARLAFVRAGLAELDRDDPTAELELRRALEQLDDADERRAKLLRASYLGHLAATLTRSGRADEVLAARHQALQAAERGFGADHPETARHRFNLAQALLDAGNPQAAEPLLAQAAEDLVSSPDVPDPDVGVALLGLAALAFDERELVHARELATTADQIFSRGTAKGVRVGHANAQMILALVDFEERDYAAAQLGFERSAAALGRSLDDDPAGDPTLALLQANAGVCELFLAHYPRARARFEASLAVVGVHTIIAHLGLAQLELRARSLDPARRHLRALASASGLDEGDELELELLDAVLAAREAGGTLELAADLRAALVDPHHPHHLRLAQTLEVLDLSDDERDAIE